MNTTPEHHTRTSHQNNAHWLLSVLSCLLLILLGLGATPAHAQTCTPTATPSATPSCTPVHKGCTEELNEDENQSPAAPALEQIGEAFQPPDGSKLSWRRYVPAGPGTFYTIVVIHGGGFYEGSPYEGGVQGVSQNLRENGYLVLSVTYRLAPCGTITGQNYWGDDPRPPESGRPPQQTDDIKSLIRAARLDPKSNGHVAVLGGSAGASHAIFVSLDRTPSPANTYPNWCNDGPDDDDRPDVAIGLSGPYDFSDREDTNTRPNFIRNVDNYANTCVAVDPNAPKDQKRVSPVAKVKSQSEQSFKPIFAVNGDSESMPPHQLEALRCALANTSPPIDPALYRTLLLID